jgi:hypothetical protein
MLKYQLFLLIANHQPAACSFFIIPRFPRFAPSFSFFTLQPPSPNFHSCQHSLLSTTQDFRVPRVFLAYRLSTPLVLISPRFAFPESCVSNVVPFFYCLTSFALCLGVNCPSARSSRFQASRFPTALVLIRPAAPAILHFSSPRFSNSL